MIFDEAHELEDVAGSYFGVSVSNARIEELCRDVEASLQRNHMLSASISGAFKSLRERALFFFALLPQGEGRFAFENRREFLEENGDEFLALQQCAYAAWARNWRICRPSRKKSSTSRGARRNCRCSSAS